MMSQTLYEARKYEKIYEKLIKKEERPAFHLSARVGWMNDPNGFSYYNGKYHMFYQYYPYESKWGPMHWGHAVSENLLDWTYLPAALAPDEPYDKDGCFSGSAVTLTDGKHLLMYTGITKERQEDGSYKDIQRQCLAIGDGITYEKYSKNPVIDETKLPKGCSRFDFRDPKIWQKEDGTYACVIGNRPTDGSGQILLFTSKNGLECKFENVLIENNNRFGKMWECPDFFKLDGKWILLTSPQDMLAEGLEYDNGNGTLCMIGNLDEKTNTFKEESNQSIDYGIDFYAPQTVLTSDGRRIMIGWMQNWETCSIRSEQEPWFGQMSLPRELFLKNGRLYQKPIREFDEKRCNEVIYKNVMFSDTITLDGIKGRRIDMELRIRPKENEEMFYKFTVKFAQNENHWTALSFCPRESMLKIDRKFSGSRRAIIHQRCSKVDFSNKELKLRIILDRFSVEVFVNDGEQVVTATMYTDKIADGISFVADGCVNMDITKYDI